MAKKSTASPPAGTDQTTLTLIQEVNRRKAEISRAERPNWKTNCSFSYDEDKAGSAVNLHVETSVRRLVLIAAFLQDKAAAYARAAASLGVDNLPPFVWGNSPVADWLADIKTRLDKLDVAAKRKKLELLEERLNKIVSPELRAKMELEAIASELK